MKKSNILKTGAAIAAFALFAPINSSAQADSTNTVRLTGVPVVKLRNQERETPVTNNITNTTQQVTQVIQPTITTASGSASGFRFATAWANCSPGTTLVGGGGSCSADNGYAAMPTSQPNGNSWLVICDAFQGGNVTANSWATCSN